MGSDLNKIKTADFIKPYKYIIFDLDGVITSEETYWNCAALVIYEILSGSLWSLKNPNGYLSNKNIDYRRAEDSVCEIKDLIFNKGKIISEFKRYGVNSNWDLGYYTLLGCVINGAGGELTPEKNSSRDFFGGVYKFIANIGANDSYSFLAELEKRAQRVIPMEEGFYKRYGVLWNYCYDLFQEWYFGRTEDSVQKMGFVNKERPLLPLDKLHELFGTLKKDGKILSVATGRLKDELKSLENWGLLGYFGNIVTYTDCINAEKSLKNTVSLSKPHPYQFLKALFAEDYTDGQIIAGEYNKEIMTRVLVIGDAASDLTAAKSIRAAFMGVLTGVLTRGDFEKQKADFICSNVLEVIYSRGGHWPSV